jgi:WD40 repeat protein
MEGEKRGIDALAFSPDGKTLVAGTYPGGLRLWDAETGEQRGRIENKDVGFDDGIFFLPDGKTLISGSRMTINWWDVVTGRETRRIDRPKDSKSSVFYVLAVSPDGKRVAAFLSSNEVWLWDAATGNEIRKIELGKEHASWCLCFSPDGQTLACGNSMGRWGNQTLFFKAATGEELRRWDEGISYTTQLAFAPDGKTVAQVQSRVIRLRDATTGKPIVSNAGLPDDCLAVRFDRDGKTLIAGCRDGRFGTWDPRTGEPLSPLRDPPESFGRTSRMLLGPALTAHGERAALVNFDGVLHVWEPATGKVSCRIAEPPVGEDQADFSADGQWLAIKHQDNLIRLWDATSGKLVKALDHPAHYGFPHPHAFSPDGRTLALGPIFPDSGVIRLCATATGKEAGRFTWRDNTRPTCLLFSLDGKFLIAANQKDHVPSGDRPRGGEGEDALRLWSRESGREVRNFPAPGGDIRSLTLSPDGKTLAAAVYNTIILWEMASGAERGRFTGHREWIWSLAFSPDGRLLASGSRDYTACVWDMTGICPDGKWSAHPVKPEELQRLWMELGHKDGVRAYRAMWELAAAGPAAVTLLAPHLRPTPRMEEAKLTQLIADLDSERFETRDRASRELQQLGQRAEPALRKALEAKPSLEVTQRLRALLEQVEHRTLTAEQLHALRAVDVLEHIGSTEAQTILRSLAAGAPGDCLTREAQAALERLTSQAKRQP